jgi:hypothetical protein
MQWPWKYDFRQWGSGTILTCSESEKTVHVLRWPESRTRSDCVANRKGVTQPFRCQHQLRPTGLRVSLGLGQRLTFEGSPRKSKDG